jgi:hypothetical protein
MLNTRLTMIQEHTVDANKVTLEEEKTRDETKAVHHHHLLSFLHARASCHAILLFFLVYRGTLSGGRSVVGARHDHVCEVKVYVYPSDLLDRRPVCSHSISRDSGSRHEGYRDCDERVTRGQTWQVGMCTGSRALVTEGVHTGVSWTLLTAEVWEGS